MRSRGEDHHFDPPQIGIFPESQLEISRGNPEASTFQEISRGQTGYFQESWKFPEVKRDISRTVGNFQRSNGIFPGQLEISRGQSGYFQESRIFPEVNQDISREVGNFQRSVRIFPGESEISRGQSGYFQGSRIFPEVDQDISRGVGNFQKT